MKFLFYAYSCYGLGLETAAAAIGLASVRKTWTSWYQLLVIMCCATVVSESCTFYFLLRHAFFPALYNTWTPIEAFTIAYVLFRETTLQWSRRLLRILLILFPVGLIIYYLFFSDFTKSNMYTDVGGMLLQLIASCAVLVDLLQDMSGVSLYARPKFWLAMGMLISTCIFTLILANRYFIIDKPMGLYYYMPFSFVANTCMYGGIIKCFLLLKKEGGVRP